MHLERDQRKSHLQISERNQADQFTLTLTGVSTHSEFSTHLIRILLIAHYKASAMEMIAQEKSLNERSNAMKKFNVR